MRQLLTMCSAHHRHENLKRMIESWNNTKENPDSCLIIYVSNDDPFLKEFKAIRLPEKASIEYGEYKTMVEVVNYLSCINHNKFDYYSEVNDDHVFMTKGWDVKMMNAIDNKNCGISIAYGQSRNMPTATMHGAKLVRILGYFFPPEYRHAWVDNWLTHLGFKTNIMAYVADVNIEHRHVVFGLAKADEVYKGVMDGYQYGRAVFEKWKDNHAEKDIELVRRHVDGVRIKTYDDFPLIKDEPLSVLMTTFQRLEDLERTVTSYLRTENRPKKLYVFDDNSPDFDKIKRIIMRIPEAFLISGHVHKGCYRKTPEAMKILFKAGAINVLVIDSDCVFANRWWTRANELLRLDLNENLVGLFNLKNHPPITNPVNGLVEKKVVGGLGLIINEANYRKYVAPFNQKESNWDGNMSLMHTNEGKKILVCSPSVLQHIGNTYGTHCDAGCTAIDFEGEPLPGKDEMLHPFKLRYIGTTGYSGSDDNGVKEIICKEMDLVYVSKIKARQLLSDYPNQWIYISSLTDETL